MDRVPGGLESGKVAIRNPVADADLLLVADLRTARICLDPEEKSDWPYLIDTVIDEDVMTPVIGLDDHANAPATHSAGHNDNS